MKDRRALCPADFHRFRGVGDPQLSPDGTRLVYAVERKDPEENKRYMNLYLMDLPDGERRPLTVGKHRDSAPRWSPDDRRIAFLSNRTGENRIWIMDVTGGEPWQVDTEHTPNSPAAWSPDGSALAYTARVFPHDKDWVPYPGAPDGDAERARRQVVPKNDSDGAVSDVKVITRLRYRFDGVGFFGDRRNHVFVVAVGEPGDTEVSPRRLTEGDHDHLGPLSWSPDGRHVAFCSSREPDADLRKEMDLWAVDTLTGRLHCLMKGAGMISSPCWSPDGGSLAFVGHDGEYGRSTSLAAWVVDVDLEDQTTLDHSDAICITRDIDRPVSSISSDVRLAPSSPPLAWNPEGDAVYFLIGDRGSGYVYRAARGEWAPQKVAGNADGVICAFSCGPDGKLVYQAGCSDRPEELWLCSSDGDRQLTDENADLLKDVWTQPAERFEYEGEDGTPVQGFLLRPRGYCQGREYPTVTIIHGGPHGAYGMSFMFQAQLLASQGMAVLYTNPRGSQTYGQDFAYAVVKDWGGGDYGDIMAGVDWALEQGIADESRLGVTGWSYGGFMSSWVVTQTDRFAAAIIGAPVTNRHSFYGTSDIGYDFGEHQCGGTPWENPDRLLERSPLAYVDRVKTAVMLVHGEGDLRCPVAQAEEFYLALRRLGHEAVMVTYPDEYHGLRQPAHVQDRMERLLAWFRHHLCE